MVNVNSDRRFSPKVFFPIVAAIAWFCAAVQAQVPTKFDFGTGPAAAGYTKVTPTTVYSAAQGYGFEPGATITAVSRGGADVMRGDYCTGTSFSFSVTVPQGYYSVTLYLGDLGGTSATTVWGEQRRFFIDRLGTASGQVVTKTFSIARRASKNATVTIDTTLGESKYVDFDDKLTLNFTGSKPCVCGVEIVPIDTAITVFLCGNSTLVDQPGAAYGEWGQYITKFFTSKVCIDNEAQSGETAHNFILEHRLAMIMTLIKPGDYVFMEFGTNDGKTDTATKAFLPSINQMIDSIVAKKSTPIVVTPAVRVNDADTIASIYGIPDTIRKNAKSINAKIIDLNSMTFNLKKALGSQASSMYVSGDPTHFCNFGGFELARCMALGIINANLDIAKYLNNDLPVFNLSKPDPVNYLTTPSVSVAAPKSSETASQLSEAGGLSVTMPGHGIRFTPGKSGEAIFSVFSLSGKQLMEKRTVVGRTQSSCSWDELGKLPMGTYFLSMSCGGAFVGKIKLCVL
jgi:lysophospholipase L1-like esterase